jgi:arsenate reductase (thioredoxin)
MAPARNIVFVCLHGSAKSLMAAEYFKRLAARRGLAVEVIAAGIEPDLDVPPGVAAGLLADGIDVRGYRPRPVAREELATASRIIAFGCDLRTLAPEGVRIEQWQDVPPATECFSSARDVILDRLQELLLAC